MKINNIGVAILFAATCAAASAATIEGSRDIQRYKDAAGGEVSQMPTSSLVDWQALDDQSLAVWTANDKPWLVRVDAPCEGLMQADNVGLTSSSGQTSVGSDFVQAGSKKCKIASIRPVDYAQVAAMHAKPTPHRKHKETMPAKDSGS